VASVLLEDAVLSECQIDAAYALAQKYFVFFHVAASFFLPAAVLRRHVKLERGYSVLPSDVPFSDPPGIPSASGSEKRQSDSVREIPAVKPRLVYDRDGLGAERLFGTHFPATPGTAIILPSDAAVDRFLSKTSVAKDDFLVFRDAMPEAADFKFRLAAASQEKPFLV
jgi:hypothetical protein